MVTEAPGRFAKVGLSHWPLPMSDPFGLSSSFSRSSSSCAPLPPSLALASTSCHTCAAARLIAISPGYMPPHSITLVTNTITTSCAEVRRSDTPCSPLPSTFRPVHDLLARHAAMQVTPQARRDGREHAGPTGRRSPVWRRFSAACVPGNPNGCRARCALPVPSRADVAPDIRAILLSPWHRDPVAACVF